MDLKIPDFETQIEAALKSPDDFIDQEFAPVSERLAYLTKMFKTLTAQMTWYRIRTFFPKNNFCVFNDFCPQKQAFRSRGFSYLMDAITCISTQPGLVIRLFNETSTNSQGVYSVWLNTNGVWKPYVIDDSVPLYINQKNKALFFLSSPNPD